jgi:hypothetical protein
MQRPTHSGIWHYMTLAARMPSTRHVANIGHAFLGGMQACGAVWASNARSDLPRPTPPQPPTQLQMLPNLDMRSCGAVWACDATSDLPPPTKYATHLAEEGINAASYTTFSCTLSITQ